jgi:hypothetical protein
VGDEGRTNCTLSNTRARHSATTTLLESGRLAAAVGLVGLTRFELVTPRLSSVCSNQLSYRPDFASGFVGASPRAVLRLAQKLSKNLAAAPPGAKAGRFLQN